MVDRTRRDVIKSIAKGAVYVSPVIYTMAAPARVMAQGPSGMMGMMMMFMFCDFFPIICMLFGGQYLEGESPLQNQNPFDPGAPPGFGFPGQPPTLPPPPGSAPPPGVRRF